jgi:hypothetical protein
MPLVSHVSLLELLPIVVFLLVCGVYFALSLMLLYSYVYIVQFCVIPCTLNFTEKKFKDIFQNSKMQSILSTSCPSCTQAAVKGIVHLTVLVSPLVRVHVLQLLIAPILF